MMSWRFLTGLSIVSYFQCCWCAKNGMLNWLILFSFWIRSKRIRVSNSLIANRFVCFYLWRFLINLHWSYVGSCSWWLLVNGIWLCFWRCIGKSKARILPFICSLLLLIFAISAFDWGEITVQGVRFVHYWNSL